MCPQECAALNKVEEALGLPAVMAPKLAPSLSLASGAYYECVLVSLMSDGNLKTGDRRKKVDSVMKKVEAVEGLYGSCEKYMHAAIQAEAARLILSRDV